MANNTYQHFSGFFEDQISKTIFITISGAINLIGLVLCGGIVWFERNCTNEKRILTNKIVSLICLYALAIGPLMFVTDFASYFFGPLNAHYCFFFHLFRGFIRSQLLFFLNSIVVARYVFIFWLKNPASLDDDFWGTIVGIYGAVLSLVANVALMLLPQKQSIFYYACADLDPRPDYKHGKLFYPQIEILATIVIHVILISRIKYYKLTNDNQSHGESSVIKSYLNKSSLASLALNCVLIAWAAFYLSFQLVINTIDLDKANLYPSYIFMHAYQLLLPTMSIFVTSGVFYVKHQHLRIKVFNKLKEMLFKI